MVSYTTAAANVRADATTRPVTAVCAHRHASILIGRIRSILNPCQPATIVSGGGSTGHFQADFMGHHSGSRVPPSPAAVRVGAFSGGTWATEITMAPFFAKISTDPRST